MFLLTPLEGVPFVMVYCAEMRMIVSPLMNALPTFLLSSPFSCSSASWSTVLMWMSNALSMPVNVFPFLSSTMTRFPRAAFKASNGLSDSMS